MPDKPVRELRFACDAMCGGLARWLRAIGYDTSYEQGIEDDTLVERADAEDRMVITSDGGLLERRVFTAGQIRCLSLPRGLKLQAQLDHVARTLHLEVRDARCTRCNGELIQVRREQVADVVPARSLVWARHFFRCAECAHVYWDGTHWRRISAVRDHVAALSGDRR